METRTMTLKQIESYGKTLRLEERYEATEQKYVGAVTAFFEFLPEGKTVSREAALAWKSEISGKFAGSTVNVMILAVNPFFAFMSWVDIRIKRFKIQRLIFHDRYRELTKAEYLRLLNAAKAVGNLRLHYLMQTLGATGIRVSELETKLNCLTEQVRLSRVRRFGASPEAAGQEVLEQMSLLFNEAEFHAEEAVAHSGRIRFSQSRGAYHDAKVPAVRSVVPSGAGLETAGAVSLPSGHVGLGSRGRGHFEATV